MEYILIIIFLVFFGVLIYRSIPHVDKNKSSDGVQKNLNEKHMETYPKQDKDWSPEKDVRPVLEKSEQGYSEFQQWILLHAGINDPCYLKTYKKKLLRISRRLNSHHCWSKIFQVVDGKKSNY